MDHENHVVTPVEAAKNPLVSGLNSPLIGQTILKILVGLIAAAGSLVALKAGSPTLASFLPDQVYTVASIVTALGTALAAASPGLREKIDPETLKAVKAAEKGAPAPPVDAPKFL